MPEWVHRYIDGKHLMDKGEHGTLLTTAGLIALHALVAQRTLKENDPIHPGVRDFGLLDAAYRRSKDGMFPPDEPVDIFLRIAMQLRGVTQEQGFLDGAKRTGLALMTVTLLFNEYVLAATQSQAVSFILEVANGTHDVPAMAAWLRLNSRKKQSTSPGKTT